MSATVYPIADIPPRHAILIETVRRTAWWLEELPLRNAELRESARDHIARLREVVRQLEKEFGA